MNFLFPLFSFSFRSFFLVILTLSLSINGHSADDVEQRLQALERVKFSGSFRMNFLVKDNDDGQKDRAGDGEFNLFNLGVDTKTEGIRFSGQYRWYNYTDTVHHLYFAMDTDTGTNTSAEIQLGLMRVPFGILPYEANSWWFGIPYYLGLNDDFDMGVKYLYQVEQWDVQAAFYTSSEFSAANTNRYSVDVISSSVNDTSTTQDNTSRNQESNQGNLRLARLFPHGEVGVSLQAGQLYNSIEEENGHHWAMAIHHLANIGNFHSQIELLSYEFSPENPDGINDDVIRVGALADSYEIAAKGNVYVVNLAYDVPIENSKVSNVRLYNDYSHLEKEAAGFVESQLNVTGVGITLGQIYTNIDFIMGRNVLYISGGRQGYAQGTEDDWSTRFNINIGYYF